MRDQSTELRRDALSYAARVTEAVLRRQSAYIKIGPSVSEFTLGIAEKFEAYLRGENKS